MMDSNTVDVKLEVDDDQGSVKNFESTNKISHDSVVRTFSFKIILTINVTC